jgi:hypothetical protein
MAQEQPTEPAAIAELRGRMSRLEARVQQLEQGLPVAARPAAAAIDSPEALPPPDAEGRAATAFTRVAMLSFALLGALILRVLTQQGILGTGFGTLLGFAYAGHLIALPFLPGRLGGFARETSLFQCSGVVLSFVIVLESALRTKILGPPAPMLLIAGFALFAVGVAVVHGKLSLAATGISGAILSLVALGLEAGELPLQLGLLVLLGAVGTALSWRRDWDLLRPLVFLLLPVLLTLGLAFAHMQSLSQGTFLAAAAGLWAIAACVHLAAFARLGRAAAWLPLLTAWLAGLARFDGWTSLPAAAAIVSALALVRVAWASRASSSASAGVAGMAATAAVAGAVGWTMLDPTGVLCALAGAAVWAAGRRVVPTWAAACAIVLMVAAATGALTRLLAPPVTVAGLAAGLVLAAILLLHYLRTGRVGDEAHTGLAERLAPLALAPALLVLYAVLREAARRLLPGAESFLLAQTGILTLTAIGLTFWGHARHRRAVFNCGVVSMAIALLKVGLVDLMKLHGLHLLASVVLLGVSSVAVSMILRRRF